MAEIKRATGLIVVEVINSNPNGDPDRDSDPRQRIDGRGEISPVSFKRKVRDLVEDKEGPVWKAMQSKLELDSEAFYILESRGRNREKIKKEEMSVNNGQTFLDSLFVKKYWDGRLFGNTFLEEDMNKGTIKTGVAQFGMGISLAKIRVERHTNTNKAGVQEGKNQGMAPLGYRVVSHGVYCMPFFINPSMAHKSGCTATDVELLKHVIPYAYAHNRSAIRPFVEIRHAWYCEHGNPLGSCSDFALIQALTPQYKNDPDVPSSSWEDYEDACGLPEDLAQKVNCLDLLSLS